MTSVDLVLPEVVSTERLSLPLITADEVADMLAGRRRPQWHADYPRTDDLDAVSMFESGNTWGPRHIVRGVTVLGSIGFFGPPTPAPLSAASEVTVPEAEVGYGLVREAWGYGFATEALRALLVEADRLGVRVRASVDPDNAASVKVLAKAGFTDLRGSDEDGQLVMARPVPAR